MAGPIPLFLLRTVLFPHMPLSLHVFEERYKQMLQDCLASGQSFGVVAIQEGEEVGGNAIPCRVGTLARIVHVERLADGRVNLVITGATRFRVVRQVPGKPYLQADVEYLEEEAPPDGNLTRRVKRAFEGYLAGLRRMAPNLASVPAISEDEVLGYLVAAMVETPLRARQRLLEAQTPAERMEMELKILRFEADLVRRRVLPVEVPAGAFSQN
ncbi:MAG: LON peptidase substrate-binding domain-containing protein [Candidatus Dormibacteraeota bacterium]|nr:LON peptidase substrate-binding domain-containing protein [Candidatus Dormibacteraeota bacterium]